VDFIERFDPPCYKLASASITDHDLLRKTRATGKPILMSTGMSTLEEIDAAVDVLGLHDLLVMHAVSMYPCEVKDLNLRMIETLRARYATLPIGYSGHETGLAPTFAAVAMGAAAVERHITLDRECGVARADAPRLEHPGRQRRRRRRGQARPREGAGAGQEASAGARCGACPEWWFRAQRARRRRVTTS
jgi:hypothetical protein